MLLTYANLSTEDVRGSTPAHYLVGVEADFRIEDEGRIVYEEPSFPVCELARSLHTWIRSGLRRDDFVFESLSFEELGVVTIERRPGGWVFRSTFTPEVVSSEVPWVEVQRTIEQFTARLGADLTAAGMDASRAIAG
jgi:hypothetical protein